MNIKSLHHNFIMPAKSTDKAGAFDIYMPTPGSIFGTKPVMVGLGFSTAIPEGYAAFILPRSSTGAKHGVELNNSLGLIDSDYRGEWKAALRTKSGDNFSWDVGDRILQFIVVPVADITLQLVDELDTTERGIEGFGSSGK